MTLDEITTTLRSFARSRKGGCRACPEYNSCGKIGCRMADEAVSALERVYGAACPAEDSEAGKWIPTAERLPEPGKEVLARCRTRGGVGYLCAAIYIAEACEYNEEQDEYFDAPGWYECIKNWDDYLFFEIADDVTHWMELPEAPNA